MKKQTKVLSGAALCAKEIKAELTTKYPRVKFSVKSEIFAGGDAVRVEWNFGPTEREVNEITDGRKDGYFDGMQDMYIHTAPRDGRATAKYITTSRRAQLSTDEHAYKYSFRKQVAEAIGKANGVEYVDDLTDVHGKPGHDHYWTADQVAARAISDTSFTSDQIEFAGVEYNREAGHGHEWRVLYTDLKPVEAPRPEPIRTAAPTTPADNTEPAAAAERVECVDYSEKSFMLYGNTYPLKEKIKSLGGRFNGFLRHPQTGDIVKGWIFPLHSKTQIITALGL